MNDLIDRLIAYLPADDNDRTSEQHEIAVLAEQIRAAQNPVRFLAVVPTDYEIYAVANTEAKAKSLALRAAKEWLGERGVKYRTLSELEEWLGCNVYPISSFGVAQEG